MSDASPDRLTQLLRAWQQGDALAGEELVPMVYAELRRIASSRLRAERVGHTLQATALVNEAWLRLTRQHGSVWENRSQFYAIAAQAMRRILVDHARRRQAARRGEGAEHLTIDQSLPSPLPDERLIALDSALDRLETLDARQARVVELRFFAGLSIDDAARVLDVSPGTVKREWKTARTWLFREIQGV